MKRLVRFVLSTVLVLGAATALVPGAAADDADPLACCKICRKGKACGDTCIARSKTCTKPPGCACDG